VIRDTVGGDVSVSDMSAGDPDSTEIAANTVGRNLGCKHNVPNAQLGDTGFPASIVGGDAKGECAGL